MPARGIVAVAVILFAGCSPLRDDDHLRSVSIQSGNSLSEDGQHELAPPGRQFYTVRVELPRGVKVNTSLDQTVLVDEGGARYRFKSASLSMGSNTPQRLSATFDIPAASRPAMLVTGDYDIDLLRSRVTKRP